MDKSSINIISPFLPFKVEDNYFIYDGGSGTLSQVDKIIYDILTLTKVYNLNSEEDYVGIISYLEKNYPAEKISEAVEMLKKYNKEGFLKYKDKIYDIFKKEYECVEKDSFKGNLWLNIAHDCNLRCKYCFGHGGSYGQKRAMMTKETAKKCIDYWFNHINKNQALFDIAFFGGEPLMNQEVMFFTVNYINHLLQGIRGKPRYNITTNGTILNDNIIKLFTENLFKISISIDGIEQIHNKNRPYASGKGSFADIVKNVKVLKEHIKLLSAQITLTKNDIPYLKECVLMLWDMGINRVYSNLVFDEEELYEYEDYESYHSQIQDLSEITYNNIIKNTPYTYNGLIQTIARVHQKEFSSNCFLWQNGAFIFSPEGDAYKCYRFIGNEKYCIGNIEQPNLNILKSRLKKERIEKCSNCWLHLHCGDGCSFEHNIYSGDINSPAEQWCTKNKILFKESLMLYARLLLTNPQRAKEFFHWR